MGGPGNQLEVARFAGDSDEDLMAYMSIKDDASCRAAAGAFYNRHKEFVFAVLKKRGAGDYLGGDEGLADVVQNTFWAAYQKADTYRPCGSADLDYQRRACRAWLIGIARNIVREILVRPVSVVSDVTLDDCIELGVEVRDVADTDPALAAAVEEALSKLTGRELEVIRVSMMFFKPGEKNQRLPNSVSQNLANHLGTTSENIRAIRKRAFDKLRAQLAPWCTGKRR